MAESPRYEAGPTTGNALLIQWPKPDEALVAACAALFPDTANGERDRANPAVFEVNIERALELARLPDFEIAFILNLAMRRDGNLFVELRTEANSFVSGFVHADDTKRKRGRIRDAKGNRMFAEIQRADVAVAIVHRECLPERRFLRRGEVEYAEHRKQRDGSGSTDSGCGKHDVTKLSYGASHDGCKQSAKQAARYNTRGKQPEINIS